MPHDATVAKKGYTFGKVCLPVEGAVDRDVIGSRQSIEAFCLLQVHADGLFAKYSFPYQQEEKHTDVNKHLIL